MPTYPYLAYHPVMRRLVLVMVLASAGTFAAPQASVEPRFGEGNSLNRPEGYHEWVFVGSSLGMSYDAQKSTGAAPPEFHNVFINPQAFHEFRETGKFPDGTVLILELVSSGSKASINQAGRFEDRILGIEAAVKDEKHFPEKWAYYSFIGPAGKPLAEAHPFPKTMCWSCHTRHGAVDNVFVQFYPVLREVREKTSP